LLNHEIVVLIQNQLKILRSLTNIPIAVVAEEPVDASSKIATLANGADQFMELPLSPDEVAMSILALIRRFTEFSSELMPVTVYFDHGVIVSPAHRKVFVNGMKIERGNTTSIRQLHEKRLKGEASNYKKEIARRSAHEVNFFELSEKDMNQLFAMD